MEGFAANGLMGLSIDPAYTNCFQVAVKIIKLWWFEIHATIKSSQGKTFIVVG